MQNIKKRTKKQKRKLRVRKKILGDGKRPRMAVFRSNKYTTAQLIDDDKGHTLAALSLNEVKKIHEGNSKMKAAHEVGKKLAQIAKSNKITKVVFDRSSYKYHGRIKELAEGAREGGLKF